MDDKEPRYGALLVAKLVPSRFKDVQALHLATGISYQTLHSWKTGASDPRMSQLYAISRKLGFDVLQLLAGEGAGTARSRMRDRPDWDPLVAKARATYRRQLPDYAYDYAGDTSNAHTPDAIDEQFVYGLARFWYEHVDDDTLERAEAAQIEREMAAEDATVEAQLRAKEAANKQLPSGPPKSPPKPKRGKK